MADTQKDRQDQQAARERTKPTLTQADVITLQKLVEQWRLRAHSPGFKHWQREGDITQCADELEAALSLLTAVPPQQGEQTEDTRVDGERRVARLTGSTAASNEVAPAPRTCPVHGWTLIQKYKFTRVNNNTERAEPINEWWCRTCGFDTPVPMTHQQQAQEKECPKPEPVDLMDALRRALPPEHTCHGGMNPPFPGPCRACERERAASPSQQEP